MKKNTHQETFTIYTNQDLISFSIYTDSTKSLNKGIKKIEDIFVSNDPKDQYFDHKLQSYTSKTKMKINDFINEFEAETPKIKRLISLFNNMEENEKFLCKKGDELNQDEEFKLIDYLFLTKGSVPKDYKKPLFTDVFAKLLINYYVALVGKNRMSIGEPAKNKRICRFCNKSGNLVSFKNKAHAISEALGNKKLILLEECDSCNEKFGRELEIHIIKYFAYLKTYYEIKGKKGLKRITGKNFELVKKNRELQIHLKQNNKKDKYLKFDKPIIYQNIYKSLCKYFLSIIDSSQLKYFNQTIDWINGDLSVSKLPLVAEILIKHINKEPIIQYYLRKSSNLKLPYAIVEFHLATKIMIFIVPFSSKDNRTFTQPKLKKFYKEYFNQYEIINEWSFIDCSTKIDDSLIFDNSKRADETQKKLNNLISKKTQQTKPSI